MSAVPWPLPRKITWDRATAGDEYAAWQQEATAAVDAWLVKRNHDGRLLIKRLRDVLEDDVAVAAALRIIVTTCPHCWDADTSTEPCYCTRDD